MEVIQTFGYDVVDSCTLIQGSCRILEYHLDVTDDFTIQRFWDFPGNTHTFVQNLSVCQWVDTDDCTADGCLTGTGLSY